LIEKFWDIIGKTIVNYRIKKFEEAPKYTTEILLNKFEKDKSKFIFPRYFQIESKSLVISIGNISLGGSGKTPLVKRLLTDFIPENYSACVIAKGYKRKYKEDIILTSDQFSSSSIEEVGDEAAMILYQCKKPVSVSTKKYKALIKAEIELNCKVFIIDDGFQHRWIKKNIDIVIVDSETLNNPHFFPVGRLREQVENINLADFILLPNDLDLSKYSFLDNNKVLNYIIEEGLPYSIISNKQFDFDNSFLAISGIAKPERFYNSLRKLSIKVKNHISFADHYNYSSNAIMKIIEKAKASQINFITTEKDAIKLLNYKEEFEKYKIDVFALPIELKIIDDKNKLKERILNELKEKKL
jgi:tetraacyldisaccharide 4'-kinase